MPQPSYHGWTHRPKAQGGTDPIEGTLQPHAYSFFSDKDLEDGLTYDLTVLQGAVFTGADGIADTIGIGDPGGETFMIADDDQDAIWVVGEPCYVAFDIECYFAVPFDGDITMWFDQANYGHAGYTSPTANVLETVYHAASTEGFHAVRLSGIVMMDPDPYDPDTTGDGNAALRVEIRQDSGSTQTIGQGWADFCRVTLANATVTYAPP